MPPQRAPLDRREDDVDGQTQEARGERQGIHLLGQAEGLGDVHDLAEAGRAHEQLGGEGEDQRNRRRDAKTRGDVRNRARELDAIEPLEAADAERAGGVQRDRVNVANAVDRLHEQRPEGSERGQEDLALQGRAERQEQQRDQRRRRDRTQKLDRDPERSPGELARAEQDADRDGERGRDAEAERPPPHGLAERDPEIAGLHHRPELSPGRRHRRQVLLRDEAGARNELPEPERHCDRDERREHRGRACCRGSERRPGPRRCAGRRYAWRSHA
jgi:hypothetical protein